MKKRYSTILGLALTLPLAALRLAPVPAQSPAVPARSLTPPAGNTLVLSAFGNGIQIYHSQRVAGAYQWVFLSPSATLYTDRSEAVPLATHYAGPTWQAITDGSAVAGRLAVTVPSLTPGSIPQLLLTAKSHRGAGVLGTVSYIQRLDTVGGAAPSTPPTMLGQEADIPYKATYNFYAAATAK